MTEGQTLGLLLILIRHERESTRVHSKDSLTYFIAWATSKLWLNIKSPFKKVTNWNWSWFLTIQSWWTENRWDTKSWWIKVPFSFANDGWKFWAFLYSYTIGYSIARILITEKVLQSRFYSYELIWFYAILFVAIGGVYHSLLDSSLFRKV